MDGKDSVFDLKTEIIANGQSNFLSIEILAYLTLE